MLGVWGLSSRSREEDVREMFVKVIEIEQVSLITDRRVSSRAQYLLTRHMLISA